MRVLADLHGGDLDNAVARAEFREIKDKIILEVLQSPNLLSTLLMTDLITAAKRGRSFIRHDVEEI